MLNPSNLNKTDLAVVHAGYIFNIDIHNVGYISLRYYIHFHGNLNKESYMDDGSNVGACEKHNSEFCNRWRYRVSPLLNLQLGMTSRSSKMSNTALLTASGLIIVCVGLYYIWTKFSKKEDKKERYRSNERHISFDCVVTVNEPVPAFIKNCIEIIEENGREHRNIYRSSANKKRVDRILDNIQDAPTLLGLEDDIDTICSCLKAYIAALSKPLIPSEQQNEFLRIFTGTNEQESLMRIIPEIPTKNRNVLASLMLHLNRIESMNATSSSLNLAICWWASLLHRNFTAAENMEHESPRLIEMISAMISHANQLF